MTATVADVIGIMKKAAPPHLAEDWDNCGLQIGQTNRPVKTVWVSLDPTPQVVAAACKNGVDLLVTHHPFLFRPIKTIDLNSISGSIIRMAVKHDLSIYTAHTNLDSAAGGVNDILAGKIGLKKTVALKGAGKNLCKLSIFVPVRHERQVLNAIFETDAGKIGDYSNCTFRSGGKGTFKPGITSKPHIGEPGETAEADEVRIETVARRSDITGIIKHIRKNHPYETMAYDVYPLEEIGDGQTEGLGRIGEFEKSVRLRELVASIKNNLGLSHATYAGDPALELKRAAICSGSGSGMLGLFFQSNADVFISGDLRYHDARDVEDRGRGLIDIGHFASEHPVVEALAGHLNKALSDRNLNIAVKACDLEKNPFNTV